MQKYVNLNTMKVGLIGYPLGHSASAAMHYEAYKEMGLDAIYIPMEVRPEEIKEAVSGLSSLGFRGCNVTIPHKIAVIPLIDTLDDSAKDCGAVNTILFKEGRLIGYNTDGLGFVNGMKERANYDPKDRHGLILGAGGAALGVAFALVRAGAKKITIINRTETKAKDLSDRLNLKFDNIADSYAMSSKNIEHVLKDTDFIVNTTKLGMTPDENSVPFDTSLLNQNHAVFDVVYNPRETRLITEAKQRGCVTLGGLWMLIYQGAEAIRIWTGTTPPIQTMAEACDKFLLTLKH